MATKLLHPLSVLLLLTQLCYTQKVITVDDIYKNGVFAQQSVHEINWMNNGRFYTSLEDNKIYKNDISLGTSVAVLVDADNLGFEEVLSEYSFNDDETKILLKTDPRYIYRRSYSNKTYVYDLQTKEHFPLSSAREMYPTFSPDGSKIAFVRDNNIFYLDLRNRKEVQVTFDGQKNEIINGATDWVYEEEFYVTKGFFWSRDGQQIAFYKFDESPVEEYTLQRWNQGQLYPENYTYKYPKAGTANSLVEVWVYDVQSHKKLKLKTGSNMDTYLPRITWTKSDQILSIQRMNRKQNQMDLLHFDVGSGNVHKVLTESSSSYIDQNFCDDLFYLDDGKHFIISSEKDGYKHFYLHAMDGRLKNQITHGDWEVNQFVAVDGKTKTLYYTSKEISPLTTTFHKIALNGSGKQLLSNKTGTTSIDMSNDTQYYINYSSDSNTPLKVELYYTDGNRKIKTLAENNRLKNAAKEYNLADKMFFEFKAEDSQVLHGYLLRPNDMDLEKKHPLLVFQYSGPGSQNVTDSWGGPHFYWHQLLVQKGYVVACVDTRGTGGRGADFKKMTYGQLGKYEAKDVISCAKHLSNLEFIDGARMGVWGWSYGGFVSSLSMFWGNSIFKSAIAVAPISSYRFYDTVYTERYMGMPKDNPMGYDENAPLFHADKLKGHYLLIHGTGDDNVHLQNSIALQDALIAAGKQFEVFLYPDRTHSMYERNAYPHLYQKMTDFILSKL
ncbi:S9 family peptidase [Flagellimonas flava]|uniref:Dipeptidyl-peptidase-4 n=1 Tax=Flagellimonas flava TaxID=570519 RepID=A0A1M5JYV4_9FLAO|nr:S9 family peptidase [Allomuricauda flava]SHG45480.1 dipeptidyl-peptidase-4 [Allomuricauda flava]